MVWFSHKVYFNCADGHTWSTTLSGFRKCKGCPKCRKAAPKTDEQWQDIIHKTCRNSNYLLKNVIGEIKGNETRLQVYCEKHDHEWEIFLYNLLSRKGCIKCGVEKSATAKLKSDAEHISEFFASGRFLVGTQFYRSPRYDKYNRRPYWFLKCPLCSKDGIDDGIFESATQSLKLGHIPCRCVKHSGFEKGVPAILYILRITGDLEFVGFGVSTVIKARIRTHKKNLLKKNSVISEMEFFNVDGGDILALENNIKLAFERHAQPVEGFKTEATHYHLYDDVLKFVDDELNKLT